MAGSAARQRASSSSRNGTPAPGATSAAAARRGGERLPRKRNIDKVYFGNHEIRTWYYSPYPFDEDEWASLIGNQSKPSSSASANPVEGSSSFDAQSWVDHAALVHQKAGGARGEVAPALQAVHLQQQHISAPHSHGRNAAGDHSPLAQHGHSHKDATVPMAKALWICDGCFKYMRTYAGFRAHKKACTFTHPPGRKVYQRGAHTIWEVDGDEQKLYAQNLSLFGKLFIDHKTIYFDVEPFLFYVLTDASPQFDHVLGFFSKEKVSYEDYNLACIVTLPPAQKKGFGTLMIEFSYYLSSLAIHKESVLGTPERPLSDLGLQGYLSYWSSVALRSLAIAFNDKDADIRARLLPATYDTDVPARSRFHAQTTAATAALAEERLYEECLRLRRALLGLPPAAAKTSQRSLVAAQASAEIVGDASSSRSGANTRRGMKGWAGEVPRLRPGSRQSLGMGSSASLPHPDESISSPSTSTSASGLDGSYDTEVQRLASTHPLLQTDEMGSTVELDGLETTLETLALALNLRTDDLCFALSECGLLRRKVELDEEAEAAALITGADPMELDAITTNAGAASTAGGSGDANGSMQASKSVKGDTDEAHNAVPDAEAMTLVITRQGVRDAMQTMRVKRPVFDIHYARV